MRHLALLTVLWLVSPLPLSAQEDSRLVAAVRLAQDGQGDSARRIVLDLLSSTPEGDTLFPQVIFTMGLVARDANDRSRNFRRVAVEFAGSSWADDALLGLAQEDFAAGRAAESARNIDRIRADYPASSLLPVAAYWAARAHFELRNTAEACRWLRQGQAIAGEDVELQNQLSFYAPRCDEAVTGPVTSPPRGSPGTPPAVTNSPAATRGLGRFSVQVAAASTETAAEATANTLRAAGYEPHIVREGGFIKVRVGHYATRAEATAAASQVRAKSGGGAFVVEEQ